MEDTLQELYRLNCNNYEPSKELWKRMEIVLDALDVLDLEEITDIVEGV